jgi:hypothetical protein
MLRIGPVLTSFYRLVTVKPKNGGLLNMRVVEGW